MRICLQTWLYVCVQMPFNKSNPITKPSSRQAARALYSPCETNILPMEFYNPNIYDRHSWRNKNRSATDENTNMALTLQNIYRVLKSGRYILQQSYLKLSFVIMVILICFMPLCVTVLVLGKLLDSVPRALMVPWAKQDFDNIELTNFLLPMGT